MITSALSRERALGDCFPEIRVGNTDRGKWRRRILSSVLLIRS